MHSLGAAYKLGASALSSWAAACLGLSADGSRPPAASANWSLLDQSKQSWILGGDGLSAFDPKQTFARGGKKSPDY
jgi:hypothetical protein